MLLTLGLAVPLSKGAEVPDFSERLAAAEKGESRAERAAIAGVRLPLRREFQNVEQTGQDSEGGYELGMYGRIPDLKKEWVLWKQGESGAVGIRTSWLVLTNSEGGDFLSISVDRRGHGQPFKVNRVPWSDMAADRFPGGFPVGEKPEGQSFYGEWIRNDVVEVSVVDTNRNQNVIEQALEYTILFKSPGGPIRMAHGYALPLGEFRLLVQHTSTNVISPEFARGITSQFFWEHVNRNAVGADGRSLE